MISVGDLTALCFLRLVLEPWIGGDASMGVREPKAFKFEKVMPAKCPYSYGERSWFIFILDSLNFNSQKYV